jgi:peptide/nickel transport system ATP-binding protein
VTEELLAVSDLRISSRLGDHERTITSSVSLRVGAGETLGIVGESGSGKSITARAIVGLLPTGLSATGSVRFRGRELLGLSERELTPVRGREISMIFQDPFTMLNPLMRCGEHIVELLRDESGRRLSRAAKRAQALTRLAEVGIHDRDVVDAYPFQLSGGMRQRVGIAAALARDPELVIADEPSTALDVTTQKEILARLRDLQESRGMGLILITHDLRVAFSICDRINVLYAGSVLERSPAAELGAEPMHPYTLGLLLSEPPGDRRVAKLEAIPGSVPEPDDVAGRCTFADRCAWQRAVCVDGAPPLVNVGLDRESACIRLPEIADELVLARLAGDQAVSALDPMSGRTPLATVTHLDKVFGSGHGRIVQALNAVSIEIGVGESVGIVGESGSGKTTLGRCLLGLEKPTAGQIIIDGVDASDYEKLSRSERRKVIHTTQMIFQDPYSTLNPVRTVGATLREAIGAADPGAEPDTRQPVVVAAPRSRRQLSVHHPRPGRRPPDRRPDLRTAQRDGRGNRRDA